MDSGAKYYQDYLDGHDDALIDIVSEYKDGLILYLNSYIRNIHLAEDLVEDTFFRLITKRPRYSGKSSFKSWLYAIGRNVAIDYIRHNSKMLHTPVEEVKSDKLIEASLEKSYLKEERKLTIHRLMQSLNEDYRNVLWLIYFEEFSHKEVSLIMKKSDRQLKNLLYRAKQSLKSKMEEEGLNDEE